MDELYWEAIYKDGTTLNQFQDGVAHSAGEVDRDNLERFRMYHGTFLIFEAFFNNDNRKRKLIFRKRNFVNAMSGDLMDFIYLVGWHERVKGVSIKSICYIYSDGHMNSMTIEVIWSCSRSKSSVKVRLLTKENVL